MSLERQQRITIKDDLGREFKLTYREPTVSLLVRVDLRRGNALFNDQSRSTNITLDTKVGDRVYYHENNMHMTKREGIVTASVPLFWDYNMPIGKRETLI